MHGRTFDEKVFELGTKTTPSPGHTTCTRASMLSHISEQKMHFSARCALEWEWTLGPAMQLVTGAPHESQVRCGPVHVHDLPHPKQKCPPTQTKNAPPTQNKNVPPTQNKNVRLLKTKMSTYSKQKCPPTQNKIV